MKSFTWKVPAKNILPGGQGIMIVEDDGKDSGPAIAMLPVTTTESQLREIAKTLGVTELDLLH
jgi:hypothetical protein